MSQVLEAIIGLEIHAQIATKTKMFCSCDNNAFGKIPNSCVCPVCIGHPGTLPVPNRVAIEKGLLAALAFGCQIPVHAKFDRKNYFYPDLPCGYQISEFDEPISVAGVIEILVNSKRKKIGITRLHLENDAGKLTHVGEFSLCDYNRAGTPLMEIVSEPDIRTPEEARVYAEEIQKILQYIGASNADMFKGEMRFDASISLRPIGEMKLYPRAEIKNLNSFKSLEAALTYEIGRQTELWKSDSAPKIEQTVGWDDEKQATYLMRDKESAADYRYFPEPDIPPFKFAFGQIEEWRKKLPELPFMRRERFIKMFYVTEQDAVTLTNTRELADYFEIVVKISDDGKKAAAWVLSELLALINKSGVNISMQKISAENLGKLIQLINADTISGKIAKEVFSEMWVTGESPEMIIKKNGLKQISDVGTLEKIVEKVLNNNVQVTADFRNGKEAALGRLIGAVMKLSNGQANPKMINELLRAKLSKC